MENEELLQEIQSLRAELTELKDLVHNSIIKPIEDDYNNRMYKEATDKWRERFKDKLEPFVEKLKATEGEDFDLYNASYNAWNETDADPDEWVELLIKTINESLEPLAKVFGQPVEDLNATIEVENGQVTDVVADTEPENTEGEETEETEVVEEGEKPAEEEKELSEEEQFQKELDEAYERMKGRR